MPHLFDASPECSVWLFKAIDRSGNEAASSRYAGQSAYIDLTPYLGEGSSVRTTKSVREPAGGFSITFPDYGYGSDAVVRNAAPNAEIESLYGHIEPMDIIEIRMWTGDRPFTATTIDSLPPVVMRGFVSEVRRNQAMGQDGRPVRMVSITGQDYGKIWQMLQVLYLPAYTQGKALLTTLTLFEYFGEQAVSAMPAGEFMQLMLDSVLNPYLEKFMPYSRERANELGVAFSMSLDNHVNQGVVNISGGKMQGAIYEIMKFHGDVGVWNELYVEDREDGVHVVYRPLPYILNLVTSESALDQAIADIDGRGGLAVVSIPDYMISNISVARTDANVANFFWVTSPRFDLIDEMSRRLTLLSDENDNTVSLREYPNAAEKYYGVRPMYAETQQAAPRIESLSSGLSEGKQNERRYRQEDWVIKRRKQMMQQNRDNVVYEQGSATVKGGPLRPDGSIIRAGDYVVFSSGRFRWLAYVVQVDHEFVPFQGYTTTLTFERGTSFAQRSAMDGSPWLVEQARR